MMEVDTIASRSGEIYDEISKNANDFCCAVEKSGRCYFIFFLNFHLTFTHLFTILVVKICSVEEITIASGGEYGKTID
jgi:hypothetical protein